jgi:hypothetical protein
VSTFLEELKIREKSGIFFGQEEVMENYLKNINKTRKGKEVTVGKK